MDLILLEPGNPDFVAAGAAVPPAGLPFGRSIALVSLHQGMKQQVTTDVSNSARTSGRPVITEFTCVKHVDAMSVKFYEHCLRAEPLGKGMGQPTRIHLCRDSGGGPALVMTIALRDALVSEIQLQTHPDGMPTEQFRLNFTEVLWTYAAQDGGDSLTAGWSLARNRPIGAFTA